MSKSEKDTPCPKGHSLHPYGYSWVRRTPNSWTRYLLRICAVCKTKSSDILNWVDVSFPVCIVCFKQDFVIKTSSEGSTQVCATCEKGEVVQLEELNA